MRQQTIEMARNMEIDALKGFAILLVVIGHAMYFSLERYSSPFYEVLASIHMPIFVAISGYLSTKPLDIASWGGVIKYWKSKVYRLLLPLLFLPCLFQYILFGKLTLPLTCILSEYWFTYTLFLIYIVFYVFRVIGLLIERKLPDKWYPWVEGIIALISIFAVEYLFSLSLGGWSNRLKASSIVWLYKYLVLGYLIGKSAFLTQSLRNEFGGAISGLIFVSAVVAYFYCGYTFTYGGTPLISIYTLIGLSGFAFTYHIAYRLTDHTRLLSQSMIHLGKQSLAIYLVHYFFLFDASCLRPYLDAITQARLQLGADVLISLAIALLTLIPTLITIKWIKSNKYLSFIMLGEPLLKK